MRGIAAPSVDHGDAPDRMARANIPRGMCGSAGAAFASAFVFEGTVVDGPRDLLLLVFLRFLRLSCFFLLPLLLVLGLFLLVVSRVLHFGLLRHREG